MCTSKTSQILDELGLRLDSSGRVVMSNYDRAESCYVHHARWPVALAGMSMVSPAFARGRFPKATFIGLVQKRPSMDEFDAVAFAAVCGVLVTPPFWYHGERFGEHVWDVIARYQLEAFFQRVERPFGSPGSHYLMRPRGFDHAEPNGKELPEVLVKWRADYRKLPTPEQIMVTAILQLYKQGEDKVWQVRVPKRWHAADAIDVLRAEGYLQDFAKLYALYPGW